MTYELSDILYSREQIALRVSELGHEISSCYGDGGELVMVGILKGAVVFMADVIRAISPHVDVRLDFMSVSSYGDSTSSSGVVRIMKDLDCDIHGRNVLIVEDIVDTGLTLSYLIQNLEARDPSSVAVCTLFDKPERRRVDVDVDFLGFSIPDTFITGYGLDVAGRWRHLPDVHTVNVIYD